MIINHLKTYFVMLKRARAFLERNKKTVAVAGMAVALAGATLRYLHTPKEHHEQKPPAQTGTRAAATMEEAARHQRIEREKLETGRMADIEKAYSPLLKNSTPDIRRILVKTMGICAEVKNSTNYSILDFHRALISLSAKFWRNWKLLSTAKPIWTPKAIYRN